MTTFTHENRPDFNSLSDERKIELLNSLYDSELDLTQRCADLRDELSISRALIDRLISLRDTAQDEICYYNRNLTRLSNEIRSRAQLRLPIDN